MEDKSKEKKEEELNFDKGSIIADRYRVNNYIDEGTYGRVYEVENIIDNNKKYAMKVLLKDKINIEGIENFRHEIDILKILQGKENNNVVNLYYHYIPPENLIKISYFVIDYAENGDLFPYIKFGRPLPEKFAKYIFKKIVEGIKSCHESNICHLDIKIENIILDSNYNPLISDFGFAEKIKDEKNKEIFFVGHRGTEYTMCPQMIINKEYKGSDADIFSLGSVLFLLVAGIYGFVIAHKNEKYYKYIFNKNKEKYFEKVSKQIPYQVTLSKEFKDLYFSIVQYEPSDRPDINDILNSPWLKEINDLEEEKNKKEYVQFLDEYSKKMGDIRNKFKNIQNVNKTDEQNQGGQRSNRGIDDEVITEYFKSDMPLKDLPENKMNPNYFIKIKGNIKPVKFMNKLCTKIKEKYGDKSKIRASKKNLKFELTFESEEIEIEDLDFEREECIIKIKLYKSSENEYILHFLKKVGDINEFYEYFLDIRKIIDSI